MKPSDIRHIRLAQQHLTATTLTNPVDVVKFQAAVQAQDYYGAKWGIGQRMLNATDELVEQAITDGSILRLHVMRPPGTLLQQTTFVGWLSSRLHELMPSVVTTMERLGWMTLRSEKQIGF